MKRLAPVLLLLAATVAAAQDSPVLRKLRDTGVVTLGYRAQSPPFSYVDAQLKPIGFSVELCERVIAELRRLPGLADLEVRQLAVSSATRIPLVANGTVDLECGITTHTAERARQVAFSTTIFVAESRLLSRNADPRRTLDDLRGQPVVSTIGTTSIHFLQAENRRQQLDLKILGGVDDVESFRILESGRAVAFAMDDVLLRSLVAASAEPTQFTMGAQSLSVEPYAIGLPRDDAEFKRIVDGVIKRLFDSGEFRAIYRRWFQQPIPPRGLNLNLPMSEALERVVKNPTDSPDPQRYR